MSKQRGLGWIDAAAGVAAYALVIRPWHLRWGATDSEITEPLPGDDLVPDGLNLTRAITIDAPPECVWPWFAQLGQDKAGFYSYTFLENLAGCKMTNAEVLRSEWQAIKPGDGVIFHPKAPPVPVALVQENQYLVLNGLGGPTRPITWAFVTRALPGNRTRLLVRIRAQRVEGLSRVPDWVMIEPIHFIMERKMMLTVKRLAEELYQHQRAEALAAF